MLNLSLKQKPVNQLKQKLIGILKLANFISLPEQDFRKFIKEIEENYLFKKLVSLKLVRFKRFPRTDWSPKFIEFNEKISSDKSSLDVETLLEEKGKVIQLIKKLGIEKFKKYFLYNEQDLKLSQIAQECNLPIEEVKDITNLVDSLEIATEFYQPPTVTPENQFYYSRIASIKKDNKEGFIIEYFPLHLARGRYNIDYEKIKLLKQNDKQNYEEIHKIDKLIKNLELINIRKTILWEILETIIEEQNKYLGTGEFNDLVAFTQKELANKIGINPSIICRLVQYKTVIMPWGEEKKLKELLPNRKGLIKHRLKYLLESEKEPYPDIKLKEKLAQDFGVVISRRSINQYRKELQTACSFNRK